MQRFLDVSDEDGRGLAIANDGKYAFNMEDGRTQITLCRSAIYAQGNSPEWYNEKESYQYTDIGPQTFHLILKPHGKKLPRSEAYRIAKKANGAYEYLADSAHPGREQITQKSFAGVRGTDDRAVCDVSNVRIMLVKKCEDDNSYIVRLLETEGKDTAFMLEFNGRKYPIQIGHEEILTLKIEENAQQPVTEVNLLEWTLKKDQ
ncbi:MAG: glycosyl hydrolase-related protein [Eisenbergiella sp.]